MQTGINGYEIYKNVVMTHAVVFADRAPEAKNAQVICENQNSKGLKKRKNSDRNGQQSDKGKSNGKQCSFWGRLGGGKSEFVDRMCLKSFFVNVLPTAARSTFLKNCDAGNELDH